MERVNSTQRWNLLLQAALDAISVKIGLTIFGYTYIISKGVMIYEPKRKYCIK